MAKRTPWYQSDWFLGLILVLGIFLTYHGVRTAGFVWDDDDHITANPTVIGPQGLKEIWTTGAGDIAPLTRSTFWLEYKFFGLAPFPYHLVNLLLQAGCAILFWLILRRLRVPGAWLAAAIWTLHPLQVESIAWISEMKNTESGLFFLLAIWFYLDEIEADSGTTWRYGLTLFFALLAMTAKASTMILPASLCICAWWLQRRWEWRNLVKMIPLVAMSVGASAMAIWATARRAEVSHHVSTVNPLPERIIGAGEALWFYVGKLVWPHPLMALYPGWKNDGGQWYLYLPLLAFVAALAYLWPGRRAWTLPYFLVLAWFVTALLPALGLVDQYTHRFAAGYSLVYDHFQYLAAMAPIALAAAGIAQLSKRLPENAAVRALPGALIVVVLSLVSMRHVEAFQTNETLWTDAAEKNPECWSCHYNVGVELALTGREDAAIATFQRSVELNPEFDRAQNNLGSALLKAGREKEAIGHFEKAVSTDDGNAEAHYNLGGALLRTGRTDEAIRHLEKTLQINPNLVDGHVYLGAALESKGQISEAIAHYESALKIDPNSALAHHNLGIDLAQMGRGDDAISHLQKAVEIDPEYGQAHSDFGVALAQRGQFREAIVQFQEALRLNPEDQRARNFLAAAQAAAKQPNAR